jgi:hypothetical protein
MRIGASGSTTGGSCGLSPTDNLFGRYKIACDQWPQPLDEERVNSALPAHARAIGAPQRTAARVAAWNATGARATRATWASAAWATRAARVAKPARDAWASMAAEDAGDGTAARDVWANMDARAAARAAIDARAAISYWDFDASYEAIHAVGARETNNRKVEQQYLPILEALEAGLWRYAFGEDTVYWLPQPAVRYDTRHRFHCEDGPAISLDDWREYFWHGVVVAAEMIETPDLLTDNRILNEANAEVRRAMIERVGHERFFAMANSKILHEDTDGRGNRRRLLSIDLPTDPEGRIVVVQVQCPSTGRVYLLRVPPAMASCAQAVAWTFGIEGAEAREFAPVVET